MSAIHAHPKHGGANVRVPPPLVFLLFTLLGVALQRWVRPLSFAVPTFFCVIAGGAAIAAGVMLIASAIGLFRKTGQAPEPWKPSPTMILEGPYKFSRNPMYVGMTAIQLGIGVALDDLWVVLLAPVAIAAIHFIAVLPEERYLTEKFGEEYVKFKARVRRYF